MKKIVILPLVVLVLSITSFKTHHEAPRIYPQLEAYFESIDLNSIDKAHVQSLENIRYTLATAQLDYNGWNFIFYCSENTFRSQVSEVFAETLCYAKRFKKIGIHSAGLQTGEISQKMISYLRKIGYKVEAKEENGNTSYEVRYADNAGPIKLFSKSTGDPSLPTKDLSSVVVCDTVTENNCKALKTVSTPFFLPFEKAMDADEDRKVAQVINQIAAEMLYVTKK